MVAVTIAPGALSMAHPAWKPLGTRLLLCPLTPPVLDTAKPDQCPLQEQLATMPYVLNTYGADHPGNTMGMTAQFSCRLVMMEVGIAVGVWYDPSLW